MLSKLRQTNFPKQNIFAVLVGAIVLLVVAYWVANANYQTHYSIALSVIGDPEGTELTDNAREGRGDEWATYIPKLKQAINSDYADISDLEPYRESNDWFIKLPARDISLFFLPNHVAFFTLSPGRALSFQNIWYLALLIFSIVWLSRNLGLRWSISVYLGGVILCSHFMQVWWTSNFPCLGALFLPFAVVTSGLNSRLKYPLLFWSFGHLIFGQFYPPFYMAAIFGLGPLILALKPDILRPLNLALIFASAMAALSIFFLTEFDFFYSVSETSYPGRRLSMGGDASINTLMSLLLPAYPLGKGFEGYNSIYEQSVIWSILPLLLIANAGHIKMNLASKRALGAVLFSLALLFTYAIWGWSKWGSLATGLFLVPGPRTYAAFSLAVTFLSALILSENWSRLKLFPSLAILLLILAVSVGIGLRTDVMNEFPNALSLITYPAVFLALCLGGSLVLKTSCDARALFPAADSLKVGLLIVAAYSHYKVYVSFNPVIDAREIFEIEDTQLLRDWDALYLKNENAPIGTMGSFGHVLRGYGRPSLSGIHLVNVDFSRYQQIFPYLSEDDTHKYFNRFVGIEFDNIHEPEFRGASVFMPLEFHAPAFEHRIVDTPIPVRLVPPIKPRIRQVSANVFEARWEAWMDEGGQLERSFDLWAPCSLKRSWITRYPIGGGIDNPEVDVELKGIAGIIEMSVDTGDKATECATLLQMGFTPLDLDHGGGE